MPEIICDCCGKVFRRRASDIKRRKNHFCSLKCAYKYRTCDIIVTNDEFKQYYDKYKLLLYKYAWSYEYIFFDELMQEALITLWQTIDKFKNKRIKNNFYSYLNVALKNHLKLYYIRNLKFNNSIHFSVFENPDFLEFSEETKINELNLDFNNFLNKIKNYPKNELCLSEKMLLEKELEGATYEYLSKKYDIEIPRIQKNIYAAKTLLRKKFKEQVKYLKEVA